MILPDEVVDDDGVRVLQQTRQLHGDLRELHTSTAEDLPAGGEHQYSEPPKWSSQGSLRWISFGLCFFVVLSFTSQMKIG